jgi:hypothetical protein
MSTLASINLLKSQTPLSPQVALFEQKMKYTSLVCLVISLIIGVLTFSVWGVVSLQKSNLSSENSRLITAVNSMSEKEGIFISLKERLKVVTGVLANQKKWSPAIDNIFAIAPAANISTVDFSPQGNLSMTTTVKSIDEAFGVVNTVLSQATAKALKNPTLESLRLDKDGSVKMIISFAPIF